MTPAVVCSHLFAVKNETVTMGRVIVMTGKGINRLKKLFLRFPGIPF